MKQPNSNIISWLINFENKNLKVVLEVGAMNLWIIFWHLKGYFSKNTT